VTHVELDLATDFGRAKEWMSRTSRVMPSGIGAIWAPSGMDAGAGAGAGAGTGPGGVHAAAAHEASTASTGIRIVIAIPCVLSGPRAFSENG
jgi:hypothetical protein